MHPKLSAVAILVVLVAAVILLGAQRETPKPATTPAASATSGKLPSQQEVESFLQKWFGYESNVKFEVGAIRPAEDPSLAEVTVRATAPQGQQLLRLYVTPDGEHAIAGDIIPFGADPFARTINKLHGHLNGATRGPADAPVLIVEFGDLECPSCKAAQPSVDKMLQDFPNVHFVFQQFPLTQIHPWAYKASEYAQCVIQQSNDAFWKFQANVYADQEHINPQNADEKLTAAATAAGVNGPQVAKCATLPATGQQVDASMKLGEEVNVTGTPTVFINGRKISNIAGVPPQTLQALINFAASPQAK